jgi:hypothetical protein
MPVGQELEGEMDQNNVAGVGATVPVPDPKLRRETLDALDANNLSMATAPGIRLDAFDPAQGYGTDPNLVTPHTPWPRALSEHERALIAVLGDLILPGTAEYPAPSAMGIVDFFDDWVSAPYDTQRQHKTVITAGLAMVDAEALRQFGVEFLKLDGPRQRKIVDDIASPTAADRSFFIRFRSLLLSGYFTSDVGFKAIGYLGNVPLRSFPSVTLETQRIIDDELSKLGL